MKMMDMMKAEVAWYEEQARLVKASMAKGMQGKGMDMKGMPKSEMSSMMAKEMAADPEMMMAMEVIERCNRKADDARRDMERSHEACEDMASDMMGMM